MLSIGKLGVTSQLLKIKNKGGKAWLTDQAGTYHTHYNAGSVKMCRLSIGTAVLFCINHDLYADYLYFNDNSVRDHIER